MSLNSVPSNDLSSSVNESRPYDNGSLEETHAQSSPPHTPEEPPLEEETPADQVAGQPQPEAEAPPPAEAAAQEPAAEAPTAQEAQEEAEAPPEAAAGQPQAEAEAPSPAEAAAQEPAAWAEEAEEAAPEAAPEEEPEEEEEALPGEAAEVGGRKRGDIVEGVVRQTTPTEVLVALEDGTEGIISSRELARMDQQALDDLRIGSSVLAYVLNPANRNGRAVLSLTRAQEEHDWRMAQQYSESQDLYTGKVSGYNKGGLIVRFGRVRGFVPASQVSEERRQRAVGESPMERWGRMIGEDIVVKVIEVNRNRNRLILSERAAVKEWRDQRKADLLDRLEVGEIRKGTVVSLTDFGAFVDLGGADGLVHLTELSWEHVTHPREVVRVGQQVEVEVISLDRERRRIGLSMKSRQNDPWESVVSHLRVGQLVRGTITKLTKFGAFARLAEAPSIEGLIHISELAEHRVGHPREVVREGEELTLRIVKIDKAQRRIGLSLKQVNAIDYLEIDLATYDDAVEEQPVALEDIQPVASGQEAVGSGSQAAAAPDLEPPAEEPLAEAPVAEVVEAEEAAEEEPEETEEEVEETAVEETEEEDV